METLLEKKSIQFLTSLQLLYLEQRDTDTLASKIDHSISWLGTGFDEVFHTYDDVTTALHKDKTELSIRISFKGAWNKAKQLDDTTCLVYGEFNGEIEDRLCDFDDISLRYTAICKLINNELKLIHMHTSAPDTNQMLGEFHVRKFVRQENTRLRNMVERATDILDEKENALKLLSDNLPGGIHQCAYDDCLTILSVNRGFLDMLGYSKQDISDKFNNQFIQMIYEDDRTVISNSLHHQLKGGNIVELEYRVRRNDGKLIWILDKGHAVESSEGTTLYCILLDITDQKHKLEKVRLTVERYNVIVDQCTDIVFEWDILDDTLFLSSNWFKKFGYVPMSKNISKSIITSKNFHPDDVKMMKEFIQSATNGVSYKEAEVRMRDSSSNYRWYRIRCSTQLDSEERPIKVIGVIIDINDEKQQKKALLEQARRDALTKLYNKQTTVNFVETILESESGFHALLIIDVDNFKDVNDKYGHLCGDAVLSTLSVELQKLFRSTDIVGRIGGDEFLVFMPDIANANAAAKKASKIVDIFNSITLDIDTELSCSVGISLYNNDATDYLGLVDCADKALYYVKSKGKSSYAFFDSKLMGVKFPVNTRTNEEHVESETIVNTSRMMVEYIFKMFYSSSNIFSVINKVLAIIGKTYSVSRVYVFEASDDSKTCSNTFEWCNDGIEPQIDKLQNMDFENELAGFFDCYDDSGIFYCQNTDLLRDNLRDILKAQGVSAILQCKMCDGDDFKGYVGFDECHKNRYWTKEQIEILTLISNLIWTFLSKLRLQEKLRQLENQIK